MNSSLVARSILVKSNIGKKCLTNSLMNMTNESLMGYLELANEYKSNLSKKETDLVEMIVYEHMNGKISKYDIKDIYIESARKTLKDNDINIKSLPGYGNSGLKRKELLANSKKDKPSINVEKE